MEVVEACLRKNLRLKLNAADPREAQRPAGEQKLQAAGEPAGEALHPRQEAAV